MKCKSCKNVIEDGSIFCRFCGVRQIKEKKPEISVPKPQRLASGAYFARIMINGERINVSAPTEPEYYLKARQIKQDALEMAKKAPKKSLKTALGAYIDKRTSVLSPSTVEGYRAILRTRFQSYMEQDIRAIDYQQMVNDEAKKVSAKTVKNAFGFIASALRDEGVEVKVTLPQTVKKELPWLDYEQIKVFCEAIRGNTQEIGMLLCLHGLRRSEVLAITPNKVKNGCIIVSGAVVRGSDGMVAKDTNKNASSTRKVPIMIPRLAELISKSDKAPDEPFVSANSNYLWESINNVCRANGLPEVGCHGLRRSFASLAVHLGVSEVELQRLGGWSDYATLHRLYVKLSEDDKTAAGQKISEFFHW